MEVKNQGLCDESQAQPCVIYARYSSYAQNDASIEQQVADCEAYAKMNNLQVVKVLRRPGALWYQRQAPGISEDAPRCGEGPLILCAMLEG